ncbi:MAG: endonuclease/exonuclease/phosphatase family protein [Bacteroidetes bacterium]|nr:endonuclease/exonuclease/phosphatase family protein [Bacteroidota bacterium]
MNNKIERNFSWNFNLLLKFKLIVLLSVCILTVSVSAQQKSESGLKVMTFNIRYGAANDGENNWRFRKGYAAETIQKFDPDILGLQEALKFQIDDLLKQMPRYKLVGVGRDDGKEAGEYSCILFKKERFKIDSTQTFWFSDSPEVPGSKSWGNEITRICTWARMTDKTSGKTFYAFNVHLDHQSQPSREKSAQLLIKRIGEKNLPIILTGDFNSTEDNPAIKTVLTSGLIDTFRTLHKPGPNQGTFHAFKGNTDGEKIDYIFVSKEFKPVSSEIITTSYNGKFPSDHFPVSAEIIEK